MTRRASPLLLALAALLPTLLSAGAAFAHAQLRGAEPRAGAVVAQAPEAARLVFNEPVAPLQARWITSNGETHDVAARSEGDALVAPLPDAAGRGTIVLSWRVVSQDGHPVGGTLAFSIGAPSENVALSAALVHEPGGAARAAAVAKFLLVCALAFGVGGAFALAASPGAATNRARRLAIAACAGAAPAALALGAATALDLAGAPPGELLRARPWLLLVESPVFGTLFAGVLAAALAGLSLAGRETRLASAGALALAAFSFALSGHAATAEPRWLTAPAIALHAGAALFWIGALPVLGAAIALRAGEAPAALARFSMIATAPVAALFLTGAALAIVQLGDAAAIFATTYGMLLAAKIACAVAMLGLAGLNRWRLAPALAARAPGAARAASRSVAAEIALALAVVALASGFRLAPPPRALDPAAQPEAYIHLHGQRAMADIVLTPGRPGANALAATILDDAFAPLDPVEVAVLLALPERGIEAIEARLARGEDGAWRADGMVLPLPGAWSVRAEILIDDFTREILIGEILIGEVGAEEVGASP